MNKITYDNELIICDECNGNGYDFSIKIDIDGTRIGFFTNSSGDRFDFKNCDKCGGSGYVDWIHNLTWRKNDSS